MLNGAEWDCVISGLLHHGRSVFCKVSEYAAIRSDDILTAFVFEEVLQVIAN